MSTSPLRGMPLGITQSKAEMRSEATNKNSWPKSKTSRTLPLLTRQSTGNSSFNNGSSSLLAADIRPQGSRI